MPSPTYANPQTNDDKCPLRHSPVSLTLFTCVVPAKPCRRSREDKNIPSPSGRGLRVRVRTIRNATKCNQLQPIATEIKVWPLLATPEPHPSSPRRRQGMERNGTKRNRIKSLPLLRTPHRRSRADGNLASRPQSRNVEQRGQTKPREVQMSPCLAHLLRVSGEPNEAALASFPTLD